MKPNLLVTSLEVHPGQKICGDWYVTSDTISLWDLWLYLSEKSCCIPSTTEESNSERWADTDTKNIVNSFCKRPIKSRISSSCLTSVIYPHKVPVAVSTCRCFVLSPFWFVVVLTCRRSDHASFVAVLVSPFWPYPKNYHVNKHKTRSILMQDMSLCDNKTQHYKQKLYDIHNRC